ncbi:LysR substrate-binding domain-containing protein [Pelagibius sp.]|uniref:LysR substrate-binding domain-containing protein n=1 Tax=Pelagibius sp. TaxID=1931238 RepID=UPI00260E082C|nr:LysR substrate-binding domain-containing protein [Pelagibius sp.]
MDLRHLRYFVTVAEEGHITRAAERLGIQQPPLSQQIRALEEELEVQLFRRKPRGVEMTEAGKALLVDARRILDEVEGALSRAKRTARGEQGRLEVGFTSSAPFHPFVPRVIRLFRENHPKVSLVLEESGTSNLVAALRAERLDVAFIRSAMPKGEGIRVYPLLDEEMFAALPKGHPLARARNEHLKLTYLAAEPLVLYRRASGPGLHDGIVAACRTAGFNPRIVQEAPRITSTLNLVAAGLGASLVPESLRRMRLEGVVFRPLAPRPRLVAPLRLACRSVDHVPAAQRFVALVRREAKVLP